MKTFSLVVFVAIVSLACGATKKKLPAYLQFCKRNDPNFDSCTVKLLDSIRPHLAKGIPQMQVPALEPLVIPALQIQRDTEALQLTATLSNLKVFGPSSFKINKFKSNFKNYGIELSITLPLLDVTTDYDVKGRILLVPLNGKGVFIANITDTRADLKIAGKLVERRGEKYFEVVDVNSKIQVGDSKMDFLGGNRRTNAISKSTSEFLHQNEQQVMEIINPIIEETANAVIKQIANRICATTPYDIVLPP